MLSPPPTCTPSRPASAPRWCRLSVCGQRRGKEEESAQGRRREKAGGGGKEAAAVATLGDVPSLGWCVSSHCCARQCCTPPSPTRVIDWRLGHLHGRIRHVDHCLAGRGLAQSRARSMAPRNSSHTHSAATLRPRQPRTSGFLQGHSLKEPNKISHLWEASGACGFQEEQRSRREACAIWHVMAGLEA